MRVCECRAVASLRYRRVGRRLRRCVVNDIGRAVVLLRQVARGRRFGCRVARVGAGMRVRVSRVRRGVGVRLGCGCVAVRNGLLHRAVAVLLRPVEVARIVVFRCGVEHDRESGHVPGSQVVVPSSGDIEAFLRYVLEMQRAAIVAPDAVNRADDIDIREDDVSGHVHGKGLRRVLDAHELGISPIVRNLESAVGVRVKLRDIGVFVWVTPIAFGTGEDGFRYRVCAARYRAARCCAECERNAEGQQFSIAEENALHRLLELRGRSVRVFEKRV